MTWQYRHAGFSDPGRVRTQNEDQWASDPAFGLYMVSDGVGSHFAGELASRAVVETLPLLLKQRLNGIRNVTDQEVAEKVVFAIGELSDKIYEQSHKEPGLDGMGATVVVLLLRENHALLAYLGDSRAYLYREGYFGQLTRDHSLAELLVDLDEISSEDAETHRLQGQITQYVGMKGKPLPGFRMIPLRPNDQLLLCTDGLTDMLSEPEILAILETGNPPETICRTLIDAANHAGGRDNITVVDVLVQKAQQQGHP